MDESIKRNGDFFEQSDESSEEDERIESLSRTKSYRFTSRILQLSLFPASAKLSCGAKEAHNCPSHQCYVYSTYLKDTLNTRLSRFMLGFNTYWLIKAGAIAYYQFEHDLILSNYSPRVRENALRTDRCARKDDIYFDDSTSPIRLEENLRWHQILGNPFASLTGVSNIIFAYYVLMNLVYYFLSLVMIKNQKIRVDSMNFLFHPNDEKLRIRGEAKKLIGGLLESFKSDYMNSLNTHVTSVLQEMQNNKLVTLKRPTQRHLKQKPQTETSTFNYVKLLFDENLAKFVNPANLSSSIFKSTISFDKYFISAIIVLATSVCSTFYMILVIMELCIRVNYRITEIECKRWNTSAVPIKNHLLLAPLDKQYEQETYLAHDGTLGSFVDLGLIEVNYYLTPSIILNMIEYNIAATFTLAMSIFYWYLYMRAYNNNKIWLKQLNQQVNTCIRMLDEHYCLTARADNGIQSRESAIFKALTISYLNFELFRRQFDQYRKLTDFLILQTALMVCLTVAKLYAVRTITGNAANELFIIFSIQLLFLLNAQLLSSALKTNRIQNLLKSLMELIALASHNSMQLSDSIDLWRRQVVTTLDSDNITTNSLFGLPISYDSTTSLNAYLIALWFVLLK